MFPITRLIWSLIILNLLMNRSAKISFLELTTTWCFMTGCENDKNYLHNKEFFLKKYKNTSNISKPFPKAGHPDRIFFISLSPTLQFLETHNDHFLPHPS
jgi:hypothetical protein